ncbi:MAG: DUF4433 domain-containing protein [Bacteroidaceae bacterium]|nr:DUF4433 domain-containing protein [Bacteroidaceae bacterium]
MHILDWFKKIFTKIPKNENPPENEGYNDDFSSEYKTLDDKKRNIKAERERISSFSTEWFAILVPEKEEKKTISTYRGYEFSEVLTLKKLKEERLHQELLKLRKTEEEVGAALDKIEQIINGRKAEYAQKSINELIEKIAVVKSQSLKNRYYKSLEDLRNLKDELRREELERLELERLRKEEEERKRREAERRAQEEKARREREEAARRKAAAQKLAEEAKRKEEAERQERERLRKLSSELKENWREFKQVLDDNGVRCLYHFTDKRNIPSIKIHGGLFSWYYCRKHNITIPCQGGDEESRDLDKKYGLEDYVRLSFCDDHPMAYRLKLDGSDIVLLKIKIDVSFLKNTMFSDMNAADKRHTHGAALQHLRNVDFGATKMHYLRNDDPKFKAHQAEVMVKTFIPKEYILNIEDF